MTKTTVGGEDAIRRTDVHRDFCEIAIVENGLVRSAGRIETTPEKLAVLGDSLGADAQVVLEATFNAVAIAAILRPRVGWVMLCEPAAVSDRGGGVKTDKLDACALAKLLASGFLREVWAPDDGTVALRYRLSRRRQLVKQRTREKNQVQAVLMRNLKPRPPMSDLFGVKGRAWLSEQDLPANEREMVDACLRHLDFLDGEIKQLDGVIAQTVLASAEMLRLMQLPGVSVTTAATLMAAIGDIRRFPTDRHLVGYFGLTRGSDSPDRSRPATGGSPSTVRAQFELSWSRPPGWQRAHPGRRKRSGKRRAATRWEC